MYLICNVLLLIGGVKMYLADTNIFLSVLLDQNDNQSASRFLLETPLEKIFISEFSMSSIGIILFQRNRLELYTQFVDDILVKGELALLSLDKKSLISLVENIQKFKLDFDDAYQYTLAEKNNLTLISFDKDFDKTERGRKTPKQILG